VTDDRAHLIRIAAALIDDGESRIFLVRKRGTAAFMQAGGKIAAGETPFEALARELGEELDLAPAESDTSYIGCFSAPAANEPRHEVEAHLFHLRIADSELSVGAELEEGLWVSLAAAEDLPLAPLTRRHVLPAARRLLGSRN
jgi:8-oxo-dGTP diphosphatase